MTATRVPTPAQEASASKRDTLIATAHKLFADSVTSEQVKGHVQYMHGRCFEAMTCDVLELGDYQLAMRAIKDKAAQTTLNLDAAMREATRSAA